jgi:hypothetical protein
MAVPNGRLTFRDFSSNDGTMISAQSHLSDMLIEVIREYTILNSIISKFKIE